MRIVLKNEQIKYAKELAKKRHEAKNIKFKNTGILTNTSKSTLVEKYIYDKSHKPHFLGLLGEMAYATVSKKNIDTNIYSVRDSGFDVGDAEVKTSTWMGKNIELKIKKNEFESKCPSKYILARIDENKFNVIELIGEISREDFNKYKVVKQYRPDNPINYVVGIEHLKPF